MIKAIVEDAIYKALKSQERPFYTERDFIWTCHKEILKGLGLENSTKYQIQYEYPIQGQNDDVKKTYYVDLAIVTKQNGHPELLLEFKYEPDRTRAEIYYKKFPVVTLGGIYKDLDKIAAINYLHRETKCLFILLDEGNHFKDKKEVIFSYYKDRNLDASCLIILND